MNISQEPRGFLAKIRTMPRSLLFGGVVLALGVLVVGASAIFRSGGGDGLSASLLESNFDTSQQQDDVCENGEIGINGECYILAQPGQRCVYGEKYVNQRDPNFQLFCRVRTPSAPNNTDGLCSDAPILYEETFCGGVNSQVDQGTVENNGASLQICESNGWTPYSEQCTNGCGQGQVEVNGTCRFVYQEEDFCNYSGPYYDEDGQELFCRGVNSCGGRLFRFLTCPGENVLESGNSYPIKEGDYIYNGLNILDCKENGFVIRDMPPTGNICSIPNDPGGGGSDQCASVVANPNSVSAGDQVLISWAFDYPEVERIDIAGVRDNLPPTASFAVFPNQDTTYTLNIIGQNEPFQCPVSVDVTGGDDGTGDDGSGDDGGGDDGGVGGEQCDFTLTASADPTEADVNEDILFRWTIPTFENCTGDKDIQWDMDQDGVFDDIVYGSAENILTHARQYAYGTQGEKTARVRVTWDGVVREADVNVTIGGLRPGADDILVQKRANDVRFAVGDTVTYTVSVTIPQTFAVGPEAILTDVYNTDLISVDLNQSGLQNCTQDIRGNVGTITCPYTPELGTTQTFSYTATAVADGKALNTATVVFGTLRGSDEETICIGDQCVVAGEPSADLTIVSKVPDQNRIAPTQEVIYTITYDNLGPDVADEAKIFDIYDNTRLEIVEFLRGTCTTNSVVAAEGKGVIECDLGAVSPFTDDLKQIIYRARALPNTSGNAQNEATISSTTPDQNPNNNTGNATVLIADEGNNDLACILTNNGPIQPGENVTISWQVFGPVVFGQMVPDIFVIGASEQGAFVIDGQGFPVPALTQTTTFELTIGDESENKAVCQTTVEVDTTGGRSADLQITKQVEQLTELPQIGDTVEFTLTIRNNGPFDAENVLVVDQIQNSDILDIIPSSVTDDGCTVSNAEIRCDAIGNLARGDERVIVYETRVLGAGRAENIATVRSDTFDTNTDNNTARTSLITVGQGSQDPVCTLAATPNPVTIGQSTTVTWAVEYGSAPEGCFRDRGDANRDGSVDEQDQSFIASLFGQSTTNSTQCADLNDDGVINSQDGVLITNIVNTSGTLTFDDVTERVGGGQFVSPAITDATTFTFTADDGGRGTSTCTASVEVDASSAADIAILKRAQSVNTPPALGDTIFYTIEYQNQGISAARNVVITDRYNVGSGTNGGLISIDESTLPPECVHNAADQEIVCTLGDLLPQRPVQQLTYQATAQRVGTVVNTAVATTDTPEVTLSNNTATATIVIDGNVVTDLSAQKSVSSTAIEPGQSVDYIITYANQGETSVQGATIVDVYDADRLTIDLGLLNGICSDNQLGVITCQVPAEGLCIDGTNGGICVNGLNAPGTSGTLSYTATANDLTGQAVNTATITFSDADQGARDSDPSNNSASASVDIGTLPAPNFTIQKDVTPEAPAILANGADATYTLTLTNTGTAAAQLQMIDEITRITAGGELGPMQNLVVNAGNIAFQVLQQDQVLNVFFPSFPPGERVEITYTRRANTDGITADFSDITNTARIYTTR